MTMNIREKLYNHDCIETQLKLEKVVYKPLGEKLKSEVKQKGDISKKVAVKIDKNTTIYVLPENVEGAVERWLEAKAIADLNSTKKLDTRNHDND